VAVTTFRPLLVAVAAVAVRRPRTARRPAHPAAHHIALRTRLLVHSLGRRGPPCPALAAVV
jgi:hypothetical protein